ncbi:hypothetical protein [Galbitalea sp. SE-J8]|uniref:hypothetical protein n=1 Tax=Galbitalea sp. SE-J8 TaxID=3054952 RepID=UPI00259C7122|nr:hypothetical protein [Galbitalea sp. SE-J8]
MTENESVVLGVAGLGALLGGVNPYAGGVLPFGSTALPGLPVRWDAVVGSAAVELGWLAAAAVVAVVAVRRLPIGR